MACLLTQHRHRNNPFHLPADGLASNSRSTFDGLLGVGRGADRGGGASGGAGGETTAVGGDVAAGLGAGAGVGAAGGSSDRFSVRSCRMGARSFFSAWATYRSNSASVACRKIALWSASGSLLNIETSLGVLIMRVMPAGV
jgi:hypothetical protein